VRVNVHDPNHGALEHNRLLQSGRLILGRGRPYREPQRRMPGPTGGAMLFTFLKDALDSRAAPRGQRLPQHGPGAAARRKPVTRHGPDISRVHEGEVSPCPPRDPAARHLSRRSALPVPLAVNGYFARPRNTRGFCGKLPSGPAADFLWVAARTPHLFPPPPSQPPAPQPSGDRVQIWPSPSFGD
jgi:hypothetical protein